MSPIKTQLFRLIQAGRYLEKQGLMDGFENYQGWRSDILNVIEALKLDFEQTVQTPLHIDNGIRWLEKTFVTSQKRRDCVPAFYSPTGLVSAV